MKNYYYIPYLYNISESLIDEFNLHLDRKRNGYYSDEEYPNNYIVEEKRYMNKNDFINLKEKGTTRIIIYLIIYQMKLII